MPHRIQSYLMTSNGIQFFGKFFWYARIFPWIESLRNCLSPWNKHALLGVTADKPGEAPKLCEGASGQLGPLHTATDLQVRYANIFPKDTFSLWYDTATKTAIPTKTQLANRNPDKNICGYTSCNLEKMLVLCCYFEKYDYPTTSLRKGTIQERLRQIWPTKAYINRWWPNFRDTTASHCSWNIRRPNSCGMYEWNCYSTSHRTVEDIGGTRDPVIIAQDRVLSMV